jgi:outer membrane protein OmpU
MKKLLMCSVALGGIALSAPALAQDGGVKLDVGGWFAGYGAFVDQDEASTLESREFDFLKHTEVHLTGETVLDNGLTVGAHFEVDADGEDSFDVQEAYTYFSGSWGRVNFGEENGVAYLLQVDAPSADENVDGVRQYINPVNYGVVTGLGAGLAGGSFDFDGDGTVATTTATVEGTLNSGLGGLSDLLVFDYDDDATGYSNKLSYMTPVFSGFQAGVSYTPETDEDTRGLEGVHADDEAGDYGSAYELALRYSGQYEQVGFAVGAGYTHVEREESLSFTTDLDGDGVVDAGEDLDGDGLFDGFALDDRQSWNIGLDLDISAFGLGVAYVEDDLGIDDGADRETWVVGADYTNGPWKLGASYYNQDQELSFLTSDLGDLETDRYTGGVTYTYGPGMTFRGSISYIDHDIADSSDVEATSVLLGTQINF